MKGDFFIWDEDPLPTQPEPAQAERQPSKEELLVLFNLPLSQVNPESEIFDRFVDLWEEYTRDSSYEFDYDRRVIGKPGLPGSHRRLNPYRKGVPLAVIINLEVCLENHLPGKR